MFERAKNLLNEFKGENYAFGDDVLKLSGKFAEIFGKRTAIISGNTARKTGVLDEILKSLEERGIEIAGIFEGARPNSPREDVYRMAYQLAISEWDSVIAIGGGSTIDASKAAIVLRNCGGVIDDYFGTGEVTKRCGNLKFPLIAVQTASSSAAHLTKYSNITDPVSAQKKLIVDDAIVPPKAIFQYDVTRHMPPKLTREGGLDGIAHCWEVWMGAKENEKIEEVAKTGIKLIISYLPKAIENGDDLEARYALGLGTDLGGYAIMLGGTSAAHLGSFSLVDILSHGEACGILNPYYMVLFAPAIEPQLRALGEILREEGYLSSDISSMKGRELGEAVANGMFEFLRRIDFPVSLKEAGATEEHIERMVTAAKDPQLKMKLENMPIPMSAERGDVDRYLKPTIEAAYEGDLSMIPKMEL
ncbi:MAG: alcohol dehydrogenase [Archaeoglobi archaeon]|nr:alcohol dehydrogenase [Archaeoglobi archaeon]MDK2781689.1 alcohol dehydrogenase [Archaeoglobi archaeon]